MGDDPTPSLIAGIQSLILQYFEVSTEEAHEHAYGLAALAEGWGGLENARSVDWAYRVKKRLGAKLKWRSTTEFESFRLEQQEGYDAYNSFIRKRGDY